MLTHSLGRAGDIIFSWGYCFPMPRALCIQCWEAEAKVLLQQSISPPLFPLCCQA